MPTLSDADRDLTLGGAGVPTGGEPGWRRMKAAVVVASLCVAAHAGLQAWQAKRLADARQLDARLVEAASRHTAGTERLARLAVLVAADPSDAAGPAAALADQLARSRDEALRLDALARRIEFPGAAAAQGLAGALGQWQDARERLWVQGESMLSHLEAGRVAALAPASARLQHEADLSRQAGHALVATVDDHAARLEAGNARLAWIGVALTVAVLAVLALAVIWPALRLLQLQSRRLARQAAELQRLALVAEHTGSLVVICDARRRAVWVNAAFTRMTGYELHEVLGLVPGTLLRSERSDAATVERVEQALDAGQPVRAELLHRSRDGRDYWVDADIQPLHGADGLPEGFISVETVITEQVTRRLDDAALMAALPAAVVVHDGHGEVLQANPAAGALLGARPGDPPDALLRLWPLDEALEPLSGDALPVPRSLRTGVGERGRVVGVDDGQGGRRWLLANAEPLRDALGVASGAVACYVDVTERRHLLDQLRDAARHDALTRMPNRSVVIERVQRAIDHHRRHPAYGFAVLFMDVDRFKQVNDSLGHAAGDELLCQVARRLEEAVRPGDAVARVGSEVRTAARVGGDEFVIVLEGLREDSDACVVADRLLADLSCPFQLGSSQVHVGVSIGIVCTAQAAADAELVLRDCDTAMYEAKRAGRGRWVLFEASMHERVRLALELEGELRRALSDGELFVVYQPVVDLGEQALAGVEALVRWRHPERGEIGPVQFIGLAEECGLIGDIGGLVLRQACAQFAAWQRQWGDRAPPLMAVNLSRAQLRQADLVADVGEVLRHTGMRAEQLQLEVTEGLAAQDDQVQAMLRALKAAGVRLALDEFGTGYSSLACLHQLPVGTVKIDRSFVSRAPDVEHHRVLISATVRVAHALGMSTVAEGIETREQAELMAALGCDRGQGSLYGGPMPAADVDRWIEREASDTLA